MGSIGTAFRAFFKTLFSRDISNQVAAVLDGRALPKITAEDTARLPTSHKEPAVPAAPKRSEAITLLATLQREARLVDLVKEDLSAYSDEQVGAAARNVLRDAASALDRCFALQRVLDQAEGATVQVPSGYDPGRYQVVGNVAGSPPYSGALTHAGWQATTVNLPTWSGNKDSALIVAPAEVEVA